MGNSASRNTTATRLIFLSYSRRDSGIVRDVSLIIWALGLIPWRDEDAIEPGTRWRLAITTAIADCSRMFVFWCRHSVSSSEVQREYSMAMDLRKEIVPLQLDHTSIPPHLGNYQAVDVRRLTRWSHEIARWERLPWLAGIALVLLGALYAALL